MDIFTPEILPHPKRGTMKIGSERIVPVFGNIRAAEGATDERPIITVTGTDGSEDRHGSVLNPRGWRTAPYLRNPVALWAHGTVAEYPYVGKTLALRSAGGGWDFDIEFLLGPWRNMANNMAAFLWEAYRDADMGAVSISFIPMKWTDREATSIPSFFAENVEYQEMELTEISFVNVPSNRNALAKAYDKRRELGTANDWLARAIGFEVPSITLASRALPPFDFASTQINLSGDVADKIRAMAEKIPADALHEKGREDTPHVTVKYGLHADVQTRDVRKVLRSAKPGTLRFGSTAMFASEGYDVVYVAVESDELRALNAAITDSLPNTTTQKAYVPHATLAYVKTGEGQRFINQSDLAGAEVAFDSIAYSDPNGETVDLPIGAAAIEADLAAALGDALWNVVTAAVDAFDGTEMDLLRWYGRDSASFALMTIDGLKTYVEPLIAANAARETAAEAVATRTAIRSRAMKIVGDRAGAVLNSSNKKKLQDIVQLVSDVLASAEKAAAEGNKSTPTMDAVDMGGGATSTLPFDWSRVSPEQLREAFQKQIGGMSDGTGAQSHATSNADGSDGGQQPSDPTRPRSWLSLLPTVATRETAQ
jgi:2'-5' RNA ligase